MSSWEPEMSQQRAKNHVLFEVMFSPIRRQICSCTHFTFCNKYMYIKVNVDLLLGLSDLSMGTGSFAGEMWLRGLMLTTHLPSSTEVQYGYSCTSTSPHCLLGILFDILYIFGTSVIEEILPWEISCCEQVTSHFTSCVIDSIDAGVGRLKYVTHIDTSIFLHINHIFTIIDGLIFCNFMCHLKYLGSYILSKRQWLRLYIFQHFLQSSY